MAPASPTNTTTTLLRQSVVVSPSDRVGGLSRQPSMGCSSSYFSNWFSQVDKTQSQLPHWITPIATTTRRLKKEVRSAQDWLQHADGGPPEWQIQSDQRGSAALEVSVRG